MTDCAEDVTIIQEKNVSIVIDGNEKTYTGTISVKSTSALIESAETLTIQKVNFVAKTSGQKSIAAPKNSYAHNLTIDNCTFKGEKDGYKKTYAIHLRHAYDVVVSNVVAEGVYDLVYGRNAVTGFTAENITVTDSTNGIIVGDGQGNFLPNQDVTREQLAVMLYQYARSKGYDVEPGDALTQPDRNTVSHWAVDAVQWAVGNGILVENGVGYLAAGDAATRADVAEAFMAFVNLYA